MFNILPHLLRFEFLYHFRRPITWLYALLIFGQGVWYGLGAHSQFGSRIVWINSAAVIYVVLASPGLILTVVACLIAGQALTKDLHFKVADYAYATPIPDRDYFLGKLLGALLTVFALALAYPLGVLTLPFFTNGPTGPVPVGQLLDGFVWLLVQNLFIIVGVAFSATVFTRRITGAYVVMFAMVLYFLVTGLTVGDAPPDDFFLLLDPFGVGMVRDTITLLSVLEKNTGYFSYPAMLFINRLLWMGLSLGLIAHAERQFSFVTFREKSEKSKKAVSVVRLRFVLPRLPFFFQSFPRALLLARHEFRGMVRQTAFQVVMAFLALLLMVFAAFTLNHPDFPIHLTTDRLTALREPLAIYVGLFLMVFSGELVFRERTADIWAIYDSLPTPTAVMLLAKLLSMNGLAFLLAIALGLTGIGLQIATQSYPIDWSLYALDLGLGAFLTYVQWIALAFLVAVLVNHRLASHVVSVVLLMILLLAPRFGFESTGPWLYGWLPGSDAYSTLSGYGAFGAARWVFSGVWLAVAGVFVVLALWGYNRGVVVTFTERAQQWKQHYSIQYTVALTGLLAIAGVGNWQITRHQYADSATLLAQTKQLWAKQESTALRTITKTVTVGDRVIPLTIRYRHPETVALWQRAVESALRRGNALFGTFPYDHLALTEVPANTEATCSLPGEIRLTETEGWRVDTRQPKQLDYLLYIATREVLKQWTNPRFAPGAGLVENSLVEYLALQAVKEQFGNARLCERLAQRTIRYERHRRLATGFEPTLAKSVGNLTVERDRGALALHSIAEVWGDKPLSLSIGQFFRDGNHVQKPASLTSAAFVSYLTNSLPKDYQFLTTYLTERPLFDASIQSVHRAGDAIVVKLSSEKWTDDGLGTLTQQLPADAMPLIVLDGSGREIYRKVVWPSIQNLPVWLPELPTARTLILDPLGAWPDVQRFNNRRAL